jgi:MFS transporter, putative metabolite:H+ symporter
MAAAEGSSRDASSDAELLGRLERLDIGKPLRRLRMQAGLGYLFDAADTATLAMIMPAVAAVWGLSTGQTGILGSSVLVGFLFGALFAGAISDAIGRRLLMFAAGSVAGALAPTWELLFAARLFTGIGCGAEAVVIAVYASEFVAARHRGRFVGTLVAFFAPGWVLAAALGWALVPLDNGWRWLQVVGGLPVLLLLWWRRYLPESPRWLLSRGRRQEAHEIIARFERESGVQVGVAPVEADASFERTVGARRSMAASIANFAVLLRPGLRKVTLSTCFLWLTVFFCFYGFNTWIPSLLVAQGYAVTTSFGFSMLIYLTQVPGYYSAARLFGRLEQKLVVIVYFLGAAGSALALSQVSTTAGILTTSCLLAFFVSGVSCCVYTYTPQIFPTAMRNSGAGLCSAVGRVGALSAPIVIGTSYSAIGFDGVFALLTCACVAGAVGVMFFGVSTQDKTLEQIERDELGTNTVLPAPPTVTQPKADVVPREQRR